MIKVSSRRASDAEGHVNARGPIARLLSDHHIKVAAAVFILAGGFNVTSTAFAEEDQAACTEKCNAEEPKCINTGASEEMCEYDKKMCIKACAGQK